MTTPHMPSSRSYDHINFFINNAVRPRASSELARLIASTIVYDATGAIWQLARPRPHGMRGSLVERRFSTANILEIAYVNERLLTWEDFSLYRLQVRMARLHSGDLLDFDPMYEKILLVATHEYLASLPRPRPQLAYFNDFTTHIIRQFVRAHCDPLKEFESVHLDFHTYFRHTDTPAICVAPPYQALLHYVEQEEEDMTGPLNEAAEDAYLAREESDDADNFDMLAFIVENDVEQALPELLPDDIIAAYVAQRYRTATIVEFEAVPPHYHLAGLYQPISDDDDNSEAEDGELPAYPVDGETMAHDGGEGVPLEDH